MTGFDEVAVARAFSPATAPTSPLTLLERAPSAPQRCLSCGAVQVAANLDGSWPSAGCRPPTSDSPVAGHAMDIPAWCGQLNAYVWVEDGRLVSDRPAPHIFTATVRLLAALRREAEELRCQGDGEDGFDQSARDERAQVLARIRDVEAGAS